MSSDLNNWAKKYEDLTNSDETIAAMQSIIHAHLCLIWKKQKSLLKCMMEK